MPKTKSRAEKKTAYVALGNDTRLAIITHLSKGERRVAELADAVGAPQALVSGHLKTLADAGFVSSRARGKFRYYALNEEFAAPFMAAFDAGWSPKTPAGTSFLRGIVGQIPVTLLATDKRGVIMLAAGQELRKFGTRNADLPGRSIFDAFDERKAAVVNVSSALRGGTVRWAARSGDEELQLVSMPYKDARGRAIGAITVACGVAPQAEAARHLAERGEWRALAEGAAVTIVQVAPDGTVQAYNHSRQFPDADLVGKNVYELMDKEFRTTAKKAITTTLRTGRMTSYEAMASDAAAQRLRFHCLVVPHWSDGRIAGVTVSAQAMPTERS